MKCRELKPTELCAAGSADVFAVSQLHAPASMGTADRPDKTEASHLFPNLVDSSLFQKWIFYSHFLESVLEKQERLVQGESSYFTHFVYADALR